MEMDGESLARQARDREDHLIDRLVFQHFFFLLVEENLMVYLYIYIYIMAGKRERDDYKTCGKSLFTLERAREKKRVRSSFRDDAA